MPPENLRQSGASRYYIEREPSRPNMYGWRLIAENGRGLAGRGGFLTFVGARRSAEMDRDERGLTVEIVDDAK